jgi:hypothetical protein
MTRLLIALAWVIGFMIGALSPLPASEPQTVDGFQKVDRKLIELV